jgi:hypothetical protein
VGIYLVVAPVPSFFTFSSFYILLQAQTCELESGVEGLVRGWQVNLDRPHVVVRTEVVFVDDSELDMALSLLGSLVGQVLLMEKGSSHVMSGDPMSENQVQRNAVKAT